MVNNKKWWHYAAMAASLIVVTLAFFVLLRWRQELANPGTLPAAPNASTRQNTQGIGSELAVPHHLQDGAEERLPLADLLLYGQFLFMANWTQQDGAGPVVGANSATAPQPDPTEQPLPDPTEVPAAAGMTANARASGCFSCHNSPFAIPGGGGEVADNLATPGLAGAGYIELLARQLTAELQAIRNAIQPGEQKALVAKGIDFGVLARHSDGAWDTSRVLGLPATSLDITAEHNYSQPAQAAVTSTMTSTAATQPPSLLVQPFHHSGTFVSLRQFTNNAFNHHHGMQSTEIYGIDIDADEDGVVNELTRADLSAITLYQATLAPPGRVIPSDPAVAAAIWQGEQLFNASGCTACHVPQLPLDEEGWIFTEPNSYNPTDQIRRGEMPEVRADLSDPSLPGPRLTPVNGVVVVPAYTDFKLHNISDMPGAGQKILTRRLWGVANEPPYFHDGRFDTLRAATLAHAGEAAAARAAFVALPLAEQDAVIEFLKSLQVLPPGARALVIDESGNPQAWPPAGSQ